MPDFVLAIKPVRYSVRPPHGRHFLWCMKTFRKQFRAGRQCGAALLMLVLLLALGLGTVLLSRGVDLRQQREYRTAVALGAARDAVIGFAVSHGRLPRPARSASDGVEQAGPCTTEQSCTGFLPWVTLGLAPTDGWGHLLRYSASPDFAQDVVDVDVAVASKTVSARDASGRLYYMAGGPGCRRSAQCLPFVVLSTGARNFGVSALGLAQANTAERNEDEARNASASRDFVLRPRSESPDAAGGEFDDMLTWEPALRLVVRMSSAGVL